MTSPALGAHTFGFVWRSSAAQALEALGEAGFRHVQLMATPPHFDPWRFDPSLTQTLRRLLGRYRLSLIALDLASNDVNLASPSRDVVDFAVDAYTKTIARAAELGARSICVGSGRRHALLSSANERAMTTFKPAFARIHAEARRRGVRVALENHPQGLLADAPTIEAFLSAEGYGDVCVIYDVANAFAIGEDPARGIEILWPRIDVVHLSDSPRGQWRHDPIGSGDIDFAAIADVVRSREFAGTVVLEILSDDPLGDLVDGVARLKGFGLPLADVLRR